VLAFYVAKKRKTFTYFFATRLVFFERQVKFFEVSFHFFDIFPNRSLLNLSHFRRQVKLDKTGEKNGRGQSFFQKASIDWSVIGGNF
jgi:hypothetical protein